jgi:hypothetical protein
MTETIAAVTAHNERTPAGLALGGGSLLAGQTTGRWEQKEPALAGSNVTHLAAQLTQGWNEAIWSRVERLLAGDIDLTPITPRPAPMPRQHQTRLSTDQVTTLIADYQAGATISELTRTYNIRFGTAARWLAVNNVPVRPRRRCIPASALPDIHDPREAGQSWAKIGQRYGCTGSKAYTKLTAQAARESES